jgi:nicotinamidase-related amidase
MHAWSCATPEQHPLACQVTEYLPRARRILETVFPPLLSAARSAGMTVLHVVGGGNYYQHLPAYQHAVQLAGADPEFTGDAPHSDANIRFRALKAQHNGQDAGSREAMAAEGFHVDFAPQAVPLEGEGIAENGAQLNALCRERGVSHLVYIGFAINWCLLTSAGGMRDMARRWYFCSTIREATTAVENKESAQTEAHKEEGLWRVSTGYGFVFDAESFIAALRTNAIRA